MPKFAIADETDIMHKCIPVTLLQHKLKVLTGHPIYMAKTEKIKLSIFGDCFLVAST